MLTNRPVRVAYWNNIPSPYMVDRFNAVADRGLIDFEGWFNSRTATDRAWGVDEESWRFTARMLPRRRIMGREVSVVSGEIRRFAPDVLISLYAEPSFVLGWHYAHRRSIATAFRVLAPSETWHPRNEAKEQLKRWMFRRVDGLLVPGPDARAYVQKYGVTKDRLFDEPQVVDADFFREAVQDARPGRQALRRELGVRGITFVYVGRFWWGKGLRYLIEAYARVEAEIEQCGLILVGDGTEEAALRERVAELGLRHVVFVGFKQHDELPAYLAAADAFVLPSLGDPYALVLDEAMSAGLPVISTTSVGEVHERVRQRETGFVVPPADVERLAEAMLELARDPLLCDRLGTNAKSLMRGRTPALWAECIEAAAGELARRRSSRLSGSEIGNTH